MTWVRIDDGFPDHPKTLALGAQGVALFITGCCWSSAALTDGVIPKHVVPVLCAKAGVKPSTVARLVAVGFWDDQGKHYAIHDYLDRNPSREQVEKERERWRRNKQRSRVDSTEDTHEESTTGSSPPRPVPSLRELHPPTTESRSEPNGRVGEVLETMIRAERAQSGPVKNRKAWERTVLARLTDEHGSRVAELVARYPTAPIDVIVGAVNGESSNLRYYQDPPP